MFLLDESETVDQENPQNFDPTVSSGFIIEIMILEGTRYLAKRIHDEYNEHVYN